MYIGTRVLYLEPPAATKHRTAPLSGYADKATPGLDLQGLIQAFERFIFEDYHLIPHSGTNTPPQVRWHNGGFLPRSKRAVMAA